MKKIADCIFCKIAAGEVPSYKVWEDEKHLAFLSIFPNTKGFTVVIPKQHYSSYCFDLPDTVLTELILATKKVGKLLDKSFENVGRTAMITEGFGVDHVHTKLIPLHGTGDMTTWKPINSSNKKYFTQYEGYVSSHDCDKADDAELKIIAEQIRQNN
ncbi:MAG: HIT family protein [Bacteroidetes bacterium]|nr:HIT family protein [Bacteroidota bacterium]